MKIRFATAAALPLAAVLALAGCAGTSRSGSMPGMDHGSAPMTTATTTATEASETDILFLTMMIPHHEQAIEMSDTLLAKTGVDDEVTALAEQIKTAQGPEIETMKGWLSDWGVSMSEGMSGMDHGGMMSESDMQALADADGGDAARLYLEQMIEHHEGAVDMAQDEIDDGDDSQVVDLAVSIVDGQTAEISTMKDLLAAL
ncbi:DUF305 domain-containing protein [Microbacterium sp. VKM Ac-2923]|uniref:DUF305 domain-containing protein n=1 Tax=Microbacterium sp. VKM Ac-2923 TaxID=2929476 RepID=UPI001FB29E87|nr:DUF305 domain-containing protein [Microbacterium sp. VKM Ac-2923]MCJ1708804.1 DUF305 domain-containing protein [Microbacterium sp. VKM Ac-2923]